MLNSGLIEFAHFEPVIGGSATLLKFIRFGL